MFTRFKVSLVEGVDAHEFADSFSSDNFVVYYFSEEKAADLVVLVKNSFIETFTSDSRILKSNKEGDHDALAPSPISPGLPGELYQQASALTRFDTDHPQYPDISAVHRPYFDSSLSIEDQQRGITTENKGNWLGSHFMPLHLYIDSDAAGLNRYEDENSLIPSQRTRVGVHKDDDTTIQGVITGDNPTRYTSKYFGDNVDIVTLEGGEGPDTMDTATGTRNFDILYHPDFIKPKATFLSGGVSEKLSCRLLDGGSSELSIIPADPSSSDPREQVARDRVFLGNSEPKYSAGTTDEEVGQSGAGTFIGWRLDTSDNSIKVYGGVGLGLVGQIDTSDASTRTFFNFGDQNLLWADFYRGELKATNGTVKDYAFSYTDPNDVNNATVSDRAALSNPNSQIKVYWYRPSLNNPNQTRESHTTVYSNLLYNQITTHGEIADTLDIPEPNFFSRGAPMIWKEIEVINAVKLDSNATGTSTDYVNKTIIITSAAGIEQTRTITYYDAVNKIAHVNSPWTTVPEADSTYTITMGGSINIIGNDMPNLGDDGNYDVTDETRIKLMDWGDKTSSSGNNLGDPTSLLSRYNNTNLTKAQRNPLMAHAIGTLSVSGGRIGGFAKKANLFPTYIAQFGRAKIGLRTIIDWHKSKARNSSVKYGEGDNASQGVPNPTILIIEWHNTNQKTHFVPIEHIKSITHKGVTTNRPTEGWSTTNLTPFVEKHLLPYRVEDPDNAGTFYWTISMSSSGFDQKEFSEEKSLLEEAWDAGITIVGGAGNGSMVYAKSDDVEYNTSLRIDANSKTFGVKKDENGNYPVSISGLETITNSREINYYPFRSPGPVGIKRDKSIDVAACQNSETHPVLDDYSSRGPGIDIMGTGRHTFSSIPDSPVEFAADTNAGGNGNHLDPNETQFIAGTDWSGYQFRSIYDSSNPYPFETGQVLKVNSLGASPKGQQTNNVNPNNIPLGGFLFTGSDVSNNQITLSNHGLVDGDRVTYSRIAGTNGSVNDITELSHSYLLGAVKTNYFVKVVDTNTIKLCANNNDLNTSLTLTVVSGGVDSASAMKFTLTHEQSQEAWNTFLGKNTVSAGNFDSDKTYIITNLGTGTDSAVQARWQSTYGWDKINSGTISASLQDRWGVGIRYKISNLGSGTDAENQANWNAYFGINSNSPRTFAVGDEFISTTAHKRSYNIPGAVAQRFYRVGDSFSGTSGSSLTGATAIEKVSVGDSFTMPNIQSATAPNLSRASLPGWLYGSYGGTSSAGPTVAGKVACIMEQFLHEESRWPTNNETKKLLLAKAKVVDNQAETLDWSNAGSPSFQNPAPLLDIPYSSYHQKSTRMLSARSCQIIDQHPSVATTFSTKTGEMKPDVTGWEPVNMPATTLLNSSIDSIISTEGPKNYISFIGQSNIAYLSLRQDRTGLDGNLGSGDAITITGVEGMTEVNNNTYYVRKWNSHRYSLFTDAALTTPLNTRSFNRYIKGGEVILYYSNKLTASSGHFLASDGSTQVKPKLGERLILSGTNATFNDGTYTLHQENSGGQFFFKSSQPLTAVGVSQTDFGSAVFKLETVDVSRVRASERKDPRSVMNVKLKNVGTEEGSAGLKTQVFFTGNSWYDIEVKSDSDVKLVIDQPIGVDLVYGAVEDTGTLTVGELRAFAKQATKKNGKWYTANLNDSDRSEVYGYRRNVNLLGFGSLKFAASVAIDSNPTFLNGSSKNPTDEGYNSVVGASLQDRSLTPNSSIELDTIGWDWTTPDGKQVDKTATDPWNSLKMGDIVSASNGNSIFDIDGNLGIIDLWWWKGPKGQNKGLLCLGAQNIPDFDSIIINGVSFKKSNGTHVTQPSFVIPSTVGDQYELLGGYETYGSEAVYWEISADPEHDSEFSRLGKTGTVDVTFTKAKGQKPNKLTFRPSETGMYGLTISNPSVKVGSEINLSSIRATPAPTDYSYQKFYNTAYVSIRGSRFDNWVTSDTAGTPPLKAFYSDKEPLSQAISSNPKLAIPNSIRPARRISILDLIMDAGGAVFPTPFAHIVSHTDDSSISAGEGYGKFGYERGQLDNNNTPISVVEATTIKVDAKIENEPSIIITSLNQESVFVPSDNSAFTVGGPLTVQTEPPTCPVTFAWQKSTNGGGYEGTWTDIASNDAIYTNANTAQMTVTGYSSQSPIGECYRCKITATDAAGLSTTIISPEVKALQGEDVYASTFYLSPGTGAGGTGFGFYDEVATSFDAGQVSRSPAFSSSVEGLNHGAVAINEGILYYLYLKSNGDLYLQLDGPGSDLIPDENITFTFTRSVDSNGLGGTAGGSISTGVPGSSNREGTYIAGYGFTTWKWDAANVPSEVAATFNSSSNFSPIKVVVQTTT